MNDEFFLPTLGIGNKIYTFLVILVICADRVNKTIEMYHKIRLVEIIFPKEFVLFY